MSRSREFVEQLEQVTKSFISEIVSNSIFRNQLGKLNKDVDSLTPEDCGLLIRDIVRSASLFVTKEQATEFESRLNSLFSKYFSQG